MAKELRIDELARQAGVASTTVRLYQSKGLLPPPRLTGRTGWYDERHLTRLRLIGRLQDEGFSLAGIARLLDEWERGRGLDAIVGVEAQLDELLGERHALVVEADELAERLPSGSLTPDLMQRATKLGLVQPTDDGRFRLPDRRFLETGAALAHLGVPLEAILDEWERLIEHTDELAARFVELFERHLAPAEWRRQLDAQAAGGLAHTLAELQLLAHQVVAAALDTSLAKVGRERLGELIPPEA